MGFIGQQYVLPQERYQEQQSPEMSGPQKRQQAFQEGLLGLEEDVKGYYSDYDALNQFAHGMWENYNVDVTRPDPTNPAAVDAYNMYLQGMAQVQERGNRMKNRQSLYNTAFQQSLVNPDVILEGEMDTFDPSKNVYTQGATSLTKQVQKRYDTSVKSKEELADLETYKGEILTDLEAKFAETTDPRTRKQIATEIEKIKAIQPTYDPTFDKNLENQRRIASVRARTGTDKSYTSNRWEDIANIRHGNVEPLRTMMRNGKKVFDDVTYSPSKGIIYVRPAGSPTAIPIDLNSRDGGAKSLNDILNTYSSMKDEQVDWNELQGFGTKYKSELGSEAMLNGKRDYDRAGLDNAQAWIMKPSSTHFKGLLNVMNKAAGQDRLEMPHLRGMDQIKIENVYYGWPDGLTPGGGRWTNQVVLEYSEEGKKKQLPLNPNDPKDKEFLKELMEMNSGNMPMDVFDIDKKPSEREGGSSTEIAEGSVAMIGTDGKRRMVPKEQVKDAKAAGYKIAK